MRSQREGIEMFLQEASEHLQYLREYVNVLQEVEPAARGFGAAVHRGAHTQRHIGKL